MRLKLKNQNSGVDFKCGDKEYHLFFTEHDGQIIISDQNGDKIASLSVFVMWGEYEKFTNNFYLTFTPENSSTDKNIADVITD